MSVYVDELVSALGGTGTQCDVYTRRTDRRQPDTVVLSPNVRVQHLQAGPPEELGTTELGGYIQEFTERLHDRMMRQPRVDAVHAHYWLSAVSAHTLKHRMNLPLITTLHTLAASKRAAGFPETAVREWQESRAARCSDLILANSPGEAVDISTYCGVDRSRVRLLTPGRNDGLFVGGDVREARRDLGLIDLLDAKVTLFAGRIQPMKGLATAIRAVHASGPDVRLIVVGGASGATGPSEVRACKSLIDELGMRSRVRFVGMQPRAIMPRWYQASDVVLVPSAAETFGFVALEAACCGRPVIGSDAAGLRLIVRDGETGYLSPVGDFSKMALAIRAVAALPEEEARELRERCIARSTEFSWTSAAATLNGYIDEFASIEKRLECCA